MTPEQRRLALKLEHLAFIARGIETTAADIPQWVRTDATRIARKAEEAKQLHAQITAGYRVPCLPGMEEN